MSDCAHKIKRETFPKSCVRRVTDTDAHTLISLKVPTHPHPHPHLPALRRQAQAHKVDVEAVHCRDGCSVVGQRAENGALAGSQAAYGKAGDTRKASFSGHALFSVAFYPLCK
jgi:hypothetical protein